MKLSEYMDSRDLRDEDMARLIGCDRSYVAKLRAGTSAPSLALMATIAEKTDGRVQPNDWLGNIRGQAA